MTKVKARWPGILVVLGQVGAKGDIAEVDDELAARLVEDGMADLIEDKRGPGRPRKTEVETATVKLEDKDK